MAWWERDYTQEPKHTPDLQSSFQWPPIGTKTLVILHVLAFAACLVMRGSAVTLPLALTANNAPWWTILTHPFALGSVDLFGFSLIKSIFVVYVIWMLGGKLERRFGTQTLIRDYILGNLLAGVGYFVVAKFLSRNGVEWLPLQYPVGAFAAWTFFAWRHLRDEMIILWGRLLNTGNMIGIAGAVVVGLTILTGRAGSTGWIVAVICGALVALITERLPEIAIGTADKRQDAEPRQAPRQSFPTSTDEDGPDIDDILDKIHRLGMDSLTKEERDRLEQARQAKLRH